MMVGAVSEVCFVICVRGAVGANLEDFSSDMQVSHRASTTSLGEWPRRSFLSESVGEPLGVDSIPFEPF